MTQPLTAWDCLRRLLATTWAPENVEVPAAVPWMEMVELAEGHGVSPLLRAALAQTDLAIPTEVQRILDVEYFQSAKYNALRRRELGALLADFSAADVEVVLLKGAALMDTAYDNVALRPMSDLDLLVPRGCVTACREILLARDYTLELVEFAPGAQMAYNNQQAFLGHGPLPVAVELHWHLVDLPYYLRRVPVEWFWQNTETRLVAGHKARVLNVEANLVHLSAHLAFHHRYDRLLWFVDLARLIHEQGHSLDWDTLAASAQSFELLLVVRETLARLAAHWPSLPLGEPLRRLRALQPTATERRIFRLTTAERRSPFLDFYTDIVCLPDLPSRLRFVLLNIFPQREYMAARYGVRRAWQLPYWYLFRLGDGAVKLARTLPQALRLR